MTRFEDNQAKAVKAFYLCPKLLWLTKEQAVKMIELEGLAYRFVKIDGEGQMGTADCRMDRIGLIVRDGLVEQAMRG